MSAEVLGWLGLGDMGVGMAANLQRLLRGGGSTASGQQLQPGLVATPHLMVWNRTALKASGLVNDPALACKLADSPASLAQQCSILCIMLIDDDACEAVLQQLLGGPGSLQGKVVVNHSTTTPDFVRAAGQRVAACGGSYVAAPVWGRPDAAAAAQLIVAPGGDASAVQRLLPFLAAHGRLLPALDAADKAAMFKLAGNFSLFGMVEVMCEALTLCDNTGIPRDTFLAFVDAFFPAKPIQGYARRAAEESIEGGVAVELALKDVRYVRQLADASRCPVPVADVVFNSLLSAAANGYGRKDIGAIFLMMQRAAGSQKPAQHSGAGAVAATNVDKEPQAADCA